MKIKTQFISSMVIFGIMLSIIAASIISTHQQVKQITKQKEIAKKINLEAGDLSYLSNDYLFYHQRLQRFRWESKFSLLSDNVSNLNPTNSEQQMLVNNIKANLLRLNAIFIDVASNFEKRPQIGDALFQISWNRMAIQNQCVAFDAERLTQTFRNQVRQLEQKNITLIFSLLGIFGTYFLTNYLIVYRNALRAISDLREGTRIIGSGNLDYFIKTKKQDEIGELSHAFNRMTTSLKIVTASKTELEKEISERKQADEALRKSEEKYRNIVDTANEGIWLVDTERRTTYVNIKMAEMLGYCVEEMIGISGLDFLDEESKSISDLKLEKRRQNVAESYEFKLIRKDRSPLWTIVNAKPLFDKDGKFVGTLSMLTDITERKQAEEALRKAHDGLDIRVQERTADLRETNKALLESKAIYKDLTESIDDLFYAMDGNLRYTYWNKASETVTGILAKDAFGKSLCDLFPDVKGTKAEQVYIETLKTQKPQRIEIEYKIRNKKFIFEINAYPTKSGLSVIAKDITERKMFEAHLLRTQRMESIGTLAGGIAHDLNNMLTPIMMSLSLLKETHKDKQSRKLLSMLEISSRRGADLIKQVLSFARGVGGERNPLQVTHIVAEIEKIAKKTFPRNIEIRTNMTNKEFFFISGDATQLHQVLMNLCVNARDAMPDGGILIISAENFSVDETYEKMCPEAKKGHYVVIAVSDTGIGIPSDIVDRIFEPFFTTKEVGKGTGLGLSTTHTIVKSHCGFIKVNSESGKGTTFKIYLPAIMNQMQRLEGKQAELFVGQGELVLVVEDEDSVRDVTVAALERYGYDVLSANNGAEAVALHARHKERIRLILMDMMMPVMDGHAGILAIRKINPGVKIIAVSGFAEKNKLKNVTGIADAFLPKPYTAEILFKTMHEVISGV